MDDIIREYERLKDKGRFDKELFRNLNLLASVEDRDAFDFESSKRGAYVVFNETLVEMTAKHFPDAFEDL